MKSVYAALMVALGCVAAVAQERSLFNGKDLAGWEGAPGWWRVEDGAITGESTAEKPCKKCNYLFWRGGQPADFELTVDCRISKNANSGIHFRSQALPDWDASGYQADMRGDGGFVGFIYYHKGAIHEFLARRGERATFAPVGDPKVHPALGKFEPAGERRVETLGDPKALLKGFKVGDWNTYRIVCRGPEIRLYLNGMLVSHATDQYPPRAVARGVIGFQMHPGHGPMKIQFKNIILKELKQPAPEKAADSPPAGHSATSTQPARKWEAARVLDKLTAGKNDGFLWDTFPGLSLRLICGSQSRSIKDVLEPGVWQHIAVVLDRGAPRLYLNGQPVN